MPLQILVALALAVACVSLAIAQQPTPEQQVAFLQSALTEVQAQRNAALDQLAAAKAQASTEIAGLKKQIEDAKPKDVKK